MADGKLLLSYLPAAERAYLYEVDGLRKYTDNTIVEPSKLEADLQCIRDRGYAVDHYERFDNSRGIAVPVLDLDGHPLLAMLCLGEIEDDPAHDVWVAQQMQALAAEMSANVAVMGDMPKANTEFAKYNLE
jgi:DNA-binding IclR family transcriptional regulator